MTSGYFYVFNFCSAKSVISPHVNGDPYIFPLRSLRHFLPILAVYNQ